MAEKSLQGPAGLSPATVFRYCRPILEHSKAIVVLCRSESMLGAVQILRKGGENNLHSHPHLDGFWFVLSGRVRFYTTNDELLAELAPYEGIVIPRTYRYWFKSVGEGEAEILQVESSAERGLIDAEFDERIDHQPRLRLPVDAVGPGAVPPSGTGTACRPPVEQHGRRALEEDHDADR